MTVLTQLERPLWSVLDEMWPSDWRQWALEGGSGFGYRRYPPVNISATDDEVVVEAELPGVDPKAIEVTLKDGELTLVGERQERALGKGEAYHRRERSCGKFVRTVSLPFRGQTGKVEATCRNGILRVRVPRAEADKPRRIEIVAA